MLQLIADRIAFDLLRLDPQSRAGAAVDFFIYDSLKILLLLFVMIAAIGFLRTWIPETKIRRWLEQRKASHLYASLFGAVTPFCSCSSIPIFLSFLRAGIPLGVAFSFLVTSPLINEYLVVIMAGSFGLRITAVYVLSGLAIGTVSGYLIGRMDLSRYIVADIVPARSAAAAEKDMKLRGRLVFGWREACAIVRKLWIWVLTGVAIGSLIHNLVPEETIRSLISRTGFWSVPLAVIIGVPMYASCAAIVPVAVVLFQKGVPLGTALAFMMAVSALSLPEAVMLRRAMRLPLIAVFFSVTTLAIIFTGYFINALF